MRRYEEALTDFTAALELGVDQGWVLANRGVAYRQMSRYEDALADFDRALELDYNQAWAIASRGETYRLMERYEEALADFDRAIELDPNLAWAIASRGETYQLMERYEEALADLSRAIELKVEPLKRAYAERGLTYRLMERYREALADFDRAIELDPDYAPAILRRGQAYRQMERYEEALKDLERAIELEPKFEHEGQKEIGLVFQSLGKPQEAADAFLKSLAAEPACSECWISLARVYEALYPSAEVPRLLRQVSISPDANTALVIACRAEGMRVTGHYEEALADFDRAIALDETLIKDWSNTRGLVLSYLGRYAEAIESYEQGLKETPNNYTLLYNIAVAMARWKGLPDAQVQINTARASLLAVVDTDERGGALYGLGGLEALEGNTDQALSYLQEAIPLEREAVSWARHDVAWLDLRADPRFQSLISETSQA